MNRNWIPSYGLNIWMSALDTPTLALANAARETLRIGDAMEQMMEGLNKVMHGEPRQEKELRKLADDINVLYTAIKLYLARMPKEELAEEESRRWAEIIEMSLNLEQASDIVERMGSEIADKSLAARRAFSLDGLKELDALYGEQLLSNLKLAMSVSSLAMLPAPVVCAAANIVFAFLIAAIPTPTSIACISKTCRVLKPVRYI